VRFYLGLSDWLDLPVSKYFKTGRSASNGGGNGGRRTTVKKKSKPAETVETLPSQPFSTPQVSMEEQKKAAYIDLLMDLAKEDGADGGSRMDLLNRLERAIGIPAEEGRP
jgi:hypothetical protein